MVDRECPPEESPPSTVPTSEGRDAVPDYRLEDQVGHLLRRAHQRHTAIFAALIGEAGLTPTQFAALAKIRDFGEVSQNQLGRATAMDPATSQGVVRRLYQRKLIERDRDPADQRRALLRLSPRGMALIEGCLAAALEISRATLEPLDPGERETFLTLLKKLI